MWNWWKGIISGEVPLEINTHPAFLIEKSLQDDKAELSSLGALVICSEKSYAQKSRDQYVVKDIFSDRVLDWKKNNMPLDIETFKLIKDEVLKNINMLKPRTYIVEKSTAGNQTYAINLRFITSSASHAFFCQQLYHESQAEAKLSHFTIYIDPELSIPYQQLGLNSSSIMAISFETKEILIVGAGQLKDIKSSLFSVMSALLPEHGVLPLISLGVVDQEERTSLFIDLSNQEHLRPFMINGCKIIGGDALGLTDLGVLNFEKGYFSQIAGPDEDLDIQSYHWANCFGALLENIELEQKSRGPKFLESGLSPQSREVFSLVQLDKGKSRSIPSHIFFLYPDEQGILPLIGRVDHLRSDKSFDHLSFGFSSSLMMRRVGDYASLFMYFLEKYKVSVWLINTNLYSGNRSTFIEDCIDLVQKSGEKKIESIEESVFQILKPQSKRATGPQYINPLSS